MREGTDALTFLPGHGKARAEAKSQQFQTVEVDDCHSVQIAILNPYRTKRTCWSESMEPYEQEISLTTVA